MTFPSSLRCGTVALFGQPNVGKSTLINALIGEHLSIVSPKAQTTRQQIRGIALCDATQIILLDTPGVFDDPKRTLDKAMVQRALSTSRESDLCCFIADVTRAIEPQFDLLEQQKIPPNRLIIVLNKIDLIDKEKLISWSSHIQQRLPNVYVFMISALRKKGIKDLLKHLGRVLPEGPWLFPEDSLTDLPQALLATEITREALFNYLNQEIPYGIHVAPETWENFKNGSIKISQIIYVTKATHRAIVLGKEGALVKKISKKSREKLSDILDRPVHLFLYVKIDPDWAEKRPAYEQMGLDFYPSS